MKSIIRIIVVTLFILLSYTSHSYAQEGCVIPPQLSYESNKSCVGATYSGAYDLNDPCYQKYLSIKNDYYLRCKSYWDDKNKSIAPTQAVQVKEIIREVIITPTTAPVQRQNYYVVTPTEEPVPTLRPIIITPSKENYYDEKTVKTSGNKEGPFVNLFSNIVNFFKKFINISRVSDNKIVSPTPVLEKPIEKKNLSNEERRKISELNKQISARGESFNELIASEKDYLKILDVDNTDSMAISGLYYVYDRLSENYPNFKELLLSTAKKMVKMDPDLSSSYSSLGRAYFINDKLDDAIAAYNKALDIVKKDLAKAIEDNYSEIRISSYKNSFAFYLVSLGDVYSKKNNLSAAKLSYQKAIEVVPDYLPAKRKLINL
jgi:tetratricopeptide (TPR) repeat protein